MSPGSGRVIKYQMVKETLSTEIEGGKYELGERLPSEKQLAEQFGVSIITIRQAVEALARAGYVEKIQGSGTYVRHLRPAVERKVWALVVPTFANYWWPPMAEGLTQVAATTGAQVVVTPTDLPGEVAESIRRVVSMGVEALAVSASFTGPVDPTPFLELSMAGIPFVFMGEYVTGVEAPRIMFDDSGGVRLALEHLLKLGHRRISLLSSPPTLWTERLSRSFLAVMNEAGVEPWPVRGVYAESWQSTDMYRAARDLLAVWPRPTAVFCTSDPVAYFLCRAAEDAGINVPGEFSVVGYGDVYTELAERYDLTTVVCSREELGREAGKLLLQMKMGGEAPPEVVITPSMKRGHTTAPPLEEAGGAAQGMPPAAAPRRPRQS